MKAYLIWSLRQLYLLFFWPTRLGREVGGPLYEDTKIRPGQRVSYLLKMLPCILGATCLGNLIAGWSCAAFGLGFEWPNSWLGVAGGVLVSLAFGGGVAVAGAMAAGLVFGLAFGVVVGLGVSMAAGLAFAVAVGLAGGVVVGLGVSMAAGLAFGLAVGLASAMGGGVAVGLAVGVAGSVAAGPPGGVAVGLAAGLAFTCAFLLTYFRLATYPLDAALATLAYCLRRRLGVKLMRAWRWCPIAWNEVIWLPLPFAGRLLALLAQEDRKEGLRQIAFVAAERRLQRRVALFALMETALNDLRADSTQELSEAADKLRWTTDAPVELPRELAAALPRFDRAAQHVGQYVALHSSYRQEKALTQAVIEVEALQKSLIASRGGAASRLLGVAAEWRLLLEAEQESLRERAATVREIPNPFVFGNPVAETEENVFTGREDIVRQVEESVLGSSHVPTLLLHGARRMGKSSILNQLPRLLGPDFAPASVDCQNPSITESTETLLVHLSHALGKALARRRVVTQPLRIDSLGGRPFTAFDEWLDRTEREMPQGMHTLLCLDEYEKLQATLDVDRGPQVLDYLRHTIQHRPRVVLMFVGSHTFEELGPAWTDRFISARRVPVSFLKPEDVTRLLTEPIPDFDMTYGAGAVDTVIEATNCQPFLVQAVAFELVQYLNEGKRREAALADVEVATSRALTSGGEYFANLWSDAAEQGQAILRAIANGEQPPDLPAARAWLREHDVLNDADGFAVPMVERWVKQRLRQP